MRKMADFQQLGVQHQQKTVVEEPLIAEATLDRALPGFEFLRRFEADKDRVSLPKDEKLSLIQLWIEVVDPNFSQVFLKGEKRKDLFWNELKMTLHNCSTPEITFDRQSMTTSEQIFQQKRHSTLFCLNLQGCLPTQCGIELSLDQIPIDVQVNYLCKFVIAKPARRCNFVVTKAHELEEEIQEFYLSEPCELSFSHPEKISTLELLDKETTVLKLSQIALQANPLCLENLDVVGLKLRIKQQIFRDRAMPSFGITPYQFSESDYGSKQSKRWLMIKIKKDLLFLLP